MKRKSIIAMVCTAALATAAVFGTLAYLTDTEKAVNTFTVGQVEITLDEAKVDKNGKPVANADRVKENDYHLLPGHRYVKDPTVTMDSDSEDSYVRIMMTVHNASAVQDIIDADDNTVTGDKGSVVDYADLFAGWNDKKWLYEGFKADSNANTITFEFRYFETVGGNDDLEPLFEELVVPGYVTNEQLAALYGTAEEGEENFKGDFKIELVAHAIQAAGFEDNEEGAWDSFDEQVK